MLYAACTPNYADHRQEISFESMHGELSFQPQTQAGGFRFTVRLSISIFLMQRFLNNNESNF